MGQCAFRATVREAKGGALPPSCLPQPPTHSHPSPPPCAARRGASRHGTSRHLGGASSHSRGGGASRPTHRLSPRRREEGHGAYCLTP